MLKGTPWKTAAALLLTLLLALPAPAIARDSAGLPPDCDVNLVPHLRAGSGHVRLTSARCPGPGQVEATYLFTNPGQGPQRLVAEVELARAEQVGRVLLKVDGRFMHADRRIEERLEFIDLGGYESSRLERIHWLVLELELPAGSRRMVEVLFESTAAAPGGGAVP